MQTCAEAEMHAVEKWLSIATRGLCAESKRRIEEEMHDHFTAALEEHAATGIDKFGARDAALADLGDPHAANARLRRIHLTIDEARKVRTAVNKYDSVMSYASLCLPGSPTLRFLSKALIALFLSPFLATEPILAVTVPVIAVVLLSPEAIARLLKPSRAVLVHGASMSLACGIAFLMCLADLLPRGLAARVLADFRDTGMVREEAIWLLGYLALVPPAFLFRDHIRVWWKLRRLPQLDSSRVWVEARYARL